MSFGPPVMLRNFHVSHSISPSRPSDQQGKLDKQA